MPIDERGEYKTKQAGERLDFTINWASEIGADSISSSSWSVPTGITQTTPTPSNTTTTTTIWLLGGTVGAEYELVNTIITAAPRTFTRTLRIKIVAGVETESIYTVELLNALKKSYASGITTCEYEGKRIQYRSLADMERIIMVIEKTLAGTNSSVRHSLASFRRG